MHTPIVFTVIEAPANSDGELWIHEMVIRPPIFEEALRLIRRFFEAVRESPEAFRGKMHQAVLILERAIARLGAKLEQFGTNRRKLFCEAYQVLRSA